jgi:hypothetical protein
MKNEHDAGSELSEPDHAKVRRRFEQVARRLG